MIVETVQYDLARIDEHRLREIIESLQNGFSVEFRENSSGDAATVTCFVTDVRIMRIEIKGAHSIYTVSVDENVDERAVSIISAFRSGWRPMSETYDSELRDATSTDDPLLAGTRVRNTYYAGDFSKNPIRRVIVGFLGATRSGSSGASGELDHNPFSVKYWIRLAVLVVAMVVASTLAAVIVIRFLS